MLPLNATTQREEALLRALWAWLRPQGCRLTLHEALRHPTYSLVLKAVAKRRSASEPAPRRAPPPPPPASAQPDLFSE